MPRDNRASRSGIYLIEEILDSLDSEVLYDRRLQVERELLVEAFRVDVLVADRAGPLPLICELAPGKRKPLVGDGTVSDEGPIHADSLAIKEIGKRFVGGSGIAE